MLFHSNLICLLKYSPCNIQYLGKTAVPLHKHINIHQTAKPGSEYMVKHFQNGSLRSSFSIQMVGIFEDDGYVNGTVC